MQLECMTIKVTKFVISNEIYFYFVMEQAFYFFQTAVVNQV